MNLDRDRASRRASRDFVKKEMDNLKQFKRLSIGQLSSIQDPDLPSASSYLEAKPYEKKDDTLWVPASVHPEVSPNEWKSFVKTRIKRDSTGSRLSQIISDEGDLKDGTAVLERKRQSQDLSSRRQSIIDMVNAFEAKTLPDRPVVKQNGVELRRSGASSRRQRPVLRKHDDVERRASESQRRPTSRSERVVLERNKSLPTNHTYHDENIHKQIAEPYKPEPPAKQDRKPNRANLRIEIPKPGLNEPDMGQEMAEVALSGDSVGVPGAAPETSKSWHLESHPRRALGHQRSLPALPKDKSPSPTRESEQSTTDTTNATEPGRENKSFWRWRKAADASPTSGKGFASLFKRKKDRAGPPTPTEPVDAGAEQALGGTASPALQTDDAGFTTIPSCDVPIESSIPPVPQTSSSALSAELLPTETGTDLALSSSSSSSSSGLAAGFNSKPEGIVVPKKSTHQRSNSQIVQRHELDELHGRTREQPGNERIDTASPASSDGGASTDEDQALEKAQAKGEMQLPYVIPAHQISDRSYVMMYHRFPLHIERAIYRFSHMKLANPRRPLREQVLLSNFMYAYLNLINQGYQQQMEQQALADHAPDDQSPHIGPRGASHGGVEMDSEYAGPHEYAEETESELSELSELGELGQLGQISEQSGQAEQEPAAYGYQDYDFEFYQQQVEEDSSSSSSSDSDVEEMWEARV